MLLLHFHQPLPKQENIDHYLGYVKRLFHGLEVIVIYICLNHWLYPIDLKFTRQTQLLIGTNGILVSKQIALRLDN